MGKTLRRKSERNMKSGVYLFRNMGSFETIFVDDTSQVAHSAQPTRSLPNILRGSNARVYKNYKTLDKNDVPFTEDANTSFDLNATVERDSERDDKCNKLFASPKSHHQRKQVHYPLDTRCDVSSWNNNSNNINKKGEDTLQIVDELGTLYVSLGEGTPTKNISNKYDEASRGRECSLKKPIRAATGKSGDKKTAKSSDQHFDINSTVTADASTAGVQSGKRNNLLGDDVSAFDIKAETKSEDWPNVFYRDNDVYQLEKRDNTNCSTVVSTKPITEYSAMQQDLLSYEFTAGANGLEENAISKNNKSNFLLASEVLCTCTCANCTICDEDLMLYEDPVPSYVNSDTEAELFTPYAYDFYTSDYYHVLGDMDGFDKIFSYEVVENTSVARENVCSDNDDVGNCGAARLIETETSTPDINVPTAVKQCELKDSQTLCTDKVQDIRVESSPIELFALSDESTESPKDVEQVRDLEMRDFYLDDLDDSSMNETTSQNQDTALIKAPFAARDDRLHKTKKDVYVIQCAQCNRLFNKKKFRRHFTHCNFYKENFKCHVCSKIYRYKSSLVHHLKVMHNISNGVYEKYYICDKCDKPYVRFRAFQRHLLVHNNW